VFPKSLNEMYALHGRRFSLDDPQLIAANAPYTFFLPPPTWLTALQPGDWVQAIFRPIPQDRKFDAERMWVRIERVLPNGITGILDTDPSDMPQLAVGAELFVPLDYVIDVQFADGHQPPPPILRKEYWGRCMVDQCVTDGRSPVDYFYREVGDLGAASDRYPDSGWRLRGSESAIEEDEERGLPPQYIAIGVVLNADDSWLHLIDEPVGAGFRRSDETDTFVRVQSAPKRLSWAMRSKNWLLRMTTRTTLGT
jgi:hypothetical protein